LRLGFFFLLLGILHFSSGPLLIYFGRSHILTAVFWLPVLFPGIFLYVVHQQFRNLLNGRREEIQSIMSRGTTFTKYLKAFESARGAKGGSLQKTFERLFYRKYGRSKYWFPLVMNTLLGGLFIIILFTWAKLPMDLPDEFTNMVRAIPAPAIAGLAGAFIWAFSTSSEDSRLLISRQVLCIPFGCECWWPQRSPPWYLGRSPNH